MLILGIDPAIATIGYALIDLGHEPGELTLVEYNVFQTTVRADEGLRLSAIRTWFETYLSTRQPDVIAFERPQFYFGARGLSAATSAGLAANALPLGMAYGILKEVAHRAGVRCVTEHNPPAVKAAVGLAKTDRKTKMRTAVSEALGLPRLKGLDDSIDAIAVALAHIKRDAVDQAQLFRVRA